MHFHGNYTVKPTQQSGGRVCASVQDVVGMNTRADISVIKRLLLYLRPVRPLSAVYLYTPYSKNNTFKHIIYNNTYYKHAHNSRACFYARVCSVDV